MSHSHAQDDESTTATQRTGKRLVYTIELREDDPGRDRLGGRGVQLLELRDRWLLIVAGAAYSGDVRRMRGAVSGALTRARDLLTSPTLETVVERLGRDILFDARTPAGLVEGIGQALDVTGSPTAATDYLAELEAIDLTTMSAYLDRMISAGPFTAQVRP